uniref:Uncharacterized protein n=1 Tax=Lepeophtheirus salmonis TaxID=72036 RepID=A0A0K2UN79_LEPSM
MNALRSAHNQLLSELTLRIINNNWRLACNVIPTHILHNKIEYIITVFLFLLYAARSNDSYIPIGLDKHLKRSYGVLDRCNITQQNVYR